MKNGFTHNLLIILFFLTFIFVEAQDLRVIDNKGTLKSINKVTEGTKPTTPVKGDIHYNSFINPTTIEIFDGSTWRKLNSSSQLANYIDNTTATTRHKIGEFDNDNNTSTPNINVNETLTSITNETSQTDGKSRKIASYTNENNVKQEIRETITFISQRDTNNDNKVTNGTARTIASYVNELRGTSSTLKEKKINETVTTLEQVVPSGTTPVSPNFGVSINTDSPGDIKYYNENKPKNGTTPPSSKVRIVSTDTGNALNIGSDGGAYIKTPNIKAAASFNKEALGATNYCKVEKKYWSNTGWPSYNPLYPYYEVTFTNLSGAPINLPNSNYVVNANIFVDKGSSIVRLPLISDKSSSGFIIEIKNSNGFNQDDTGCMFTVYSW